MISFIIPAYNEEGLLGPVLEALERAAVGAEIPFEIIVVNDASTDRTREIACESGARVIDVSFRQIAATRNAGAREARGDILVFVDADTIVLPGTIEAVGVAVREGAVGGGGFVDFDEVSRGWRAFWVVFRFIYHRLHLAAGCFVFARRDGFEAIGGFDERYYASEEVHLSRALRRLGAFRIVRPGVITSGRKCRIYSLKHVLGVFFGILFRGSRGLRSREHLTIWYDGTREVDPPIPGHRRHP